MTPKKVEITTHDELQSWLKGKSRAWAGAIAARAALRAFPLVLAEIPDTADKRRRAPGRAVLTLETARANLIAWTAALSPDYGQALESAAGDAADAAAAASTAYAYVAVAAAAAAGAAADAAYAANAAYADTDADAATDAAAHAAAGAASAATNVANVDTDAASANAATSWGAVTADMNWLLDHESQSLLIRQPLWLIEVRGKRVYNVNFPEWARTPFDVFDKTDWVANGPWGVWLAWYREILSVSRNSKSSLFTAKRALEIASMDKAFWHSDPHRVTASVAALVGWKWRESSWTWPDETTVTTDPAPEVLKPPRRRQLESVNPQSDEPTADDRLNRRPFARALVERLDDVFAQGAPDGFAMHIHAPWGSGKTSVLKMMRKLMTILGRTAKDGKIAPQWVVVDFNAWQNERRNPPWWPLIEEVKNECLGSLSPEKVGWVRLFKACSTRLWQVGGRTQARTEDKAALLELRWLWWKIRTDLIPYLIAIVVAVFCFWLLWSVRTSSGDKMPIFFDAILKLLTVITTAYIAFLGASRVAFFGSATAAKLYEDISRDPLDRITGLFKLIVGKGKGTEKPICILIDDLDRCSADYVVDLLEGIQTSFRHPNVAYVIAADRAWIKASFEARYGKVFETVGTAGQPLGYLFLEKIFQVSTPLPGMGSQTRAAYWDELVKGVGLRNDETVPVETIGPATALPSMDRLIDEKRAELRRDYGGNITGEQADQALTKSNTPEDRAAVALELTASPEAAVEAQHLLSQFRDIVPDIPRVMKRMVNAYALRRAIGLLENTRLSTEVLARWTILEQRYPALADLLIEKPEWIDLIANQVAANAQKDVPEPLKPFINSPELIGIIASASDQALTGTRVRALTRGSST